MKLMCCFGLLESIADGNGRERGSGTNCSPRDQEAKEKEGPELHSPLKGYIPMTQGPPTGPTSQQSTSLPTSTTLRTKLLTHGPKGHLTKLKHYLRLSLLSTNLKLLPQNRLVRLRIISDIFVSVSNFGV
jgi:hypothetical protein